MTYNAIAESNRRRRKFPPEITQARHSYRTHRFNAVKRGVEFLLSFEEWWEIWQASGKWSQRGAGRGKYCMSRYGDVGPYAIGNVFINGFGRNTHEGVSGIKRTIGQNAARAEFMRGNKNSVGRKWMHKDGKVECVRKHEIEARLASGWKPGRKPDVANTVIAPA